MEEKEVGVKEKGNHGKARVKEKEMLQCTHHSHTHATDVGL